ncbi:hypothetical protein MKZ38_003359 [Zalerion maritima]|uniref:Uncharacterized protein n=1 Tax=Zalerion maritima TaxID=339359 RepID=A0AAD5WQQ6_9PEZI|nr:hypothetical protein MKZ38_003359 [Zalerion maritima]
MPFTLRSLLPLTREKASPQSQAYRPTPTEDPYASEDEDSSDAELATPKDPLNGSPSPRKSWHPPSSSTHHTNTLLRATLIVLYTIAIFVLGAWFWSLVAPPSGRPTPGSASGPILEDDRGIPYVRDTVFEASSRLNASMARMYAGAPGKGLDETWKRLLRCTSRFLPPSPLPLSSSLPSPFFMTTATTRKIWHPSARDFEIGGESNDAAAAADADSDADVVALHCLDTLRQAIQCQGDSSLVTFRWGQSQPIPLGNFSSAHTCVDWERLEEYNKARHVDVFQEGLVVHPVYGPAYAEEMKGKGKGLGVVEDEG